MKIKQIVCALLTMAALFISPLSATEKCVYHPTFPNVNQPEFVTAFGNNNYAALQSVVAAEVNILKAAGVTMVTTGYPAGGDPTRFWQACDIARSMGIKVFVPMHGSDMIPYYSNYTSHFDGYTIADEPILNGWSASTVAVMTSNAVSQGKEAWVNFAGSNAGQVRAFVETNTSNGRIADHLDIISVDHYSTSNPLSVYNQVASVANSHGLKFMAILGNTRNASLSHLNGQRNAAVSAGADILGLWTMDGQDSGRTAANFTGCNNPTAGSSYDGTLNWELTYSIEDDGYGNWYYETVCAPEGVLDPYDVVESGPYTFILKSIVNTKPTLWNAFSSY